MTTVVVNDEPLSREEYPPIKMRVFGADLADSAGAFRTRGYR
jgi:hypothetical protein